jgi:lantibiotic biosynthesis protein
MSAGFFVLRVPLLPVETLEQLSDPSPALRVPSDDDDELEAALVADRTRMRLGARALLEDPSLARAMRFGPRDLHDGLRHWLIDPDSRRGRSAERSLLRYLTRMCTRPALYGTFAAYAIGELDSPPTCLRLADRSQIRARIRLDPGGLGQLLASAAAAAADSDELLVQRDPAVYEVAGMLRFATTRGAGGKPHRRRIVALRPTSAVRAVLAAAAEPVPVGELIARAGIGPAAGRELLTGLIDSGALHPAAMLPATGEGASAQAITGLRAIPGAAAVRLAVQRAEQNLAGGSEAGLAAAEAELVRAGLAPSAAARTHVDAIRPADARLPPVVSRELANAIELLERVAPARENPALVHFREDFQRRYGSRPVPLLEAVDPDCGVILHDEHVPDPPAIGPLLLELIDRGRESGEVELSDADVATLERSGPRLPPPDAFALLFQVQARGAASIDAGEFALVEPELLGPSGARTLGRLCDGDPSLSRRLAEHLRGEEASQPDAIFAELVCVPDTDGGLAITYRPVLREWEIECGGRSGAAPERRLEASDLLLSYERELVVRSRRLGRRVVVRASTAMNHRWVSLPAVRLLRLLEAQGRAGHLRWSWAEVSAAPALPRVRRGRIVLSRRRWNLPLTGLDGAGPRCDAATYRALQRWRHANCVPARVAVLGHKGELTVDLSTVLGAEMFLSAVRSDQRAHLVEVAGAQDRAVESTDGHYAHEMIVPCLRSEQVARRGPSGHATRGRQRVAGALGPLESLAASADVPLHARRFAPGSQWLYAKLYGPAAAADSVLADVIAGLERHGRLEQWFFVRYADPDRHLRLRIHGEPSRLWGELLPALHEVSLPALADGRLYRIAIDTYEREIERFGGLGGVELMERAAHADSICSVRMISERSTAVAPHMLAVASVAALLNDAGLEVGEREQLCAASRDELAPSGASVARLLARAERTERPNVERLLTELELESEPPSSAALVALRQRSTVIRPLLAGIDDLGLQRSTPSVVAILAHLQLNRVLRRSGAMDELRVYDALARAYRSRRLRDGSDAKRAWGRR